MYYSASAWSARIALAHSKVESDECIRLFISGDRSQVGKSSISLGLVAYLLERMNFAPEEIAYIKPATQCESVQLVERFCKFKGVDCVPVGPVVFYSGFTREYLAGNTKSSTEMAAEVATVVDNLCNKPGRKIVIIDGVGYPSVGSIVGFCNAVSAKACRAPVVLVCPKGVGNAVDSYNLNKSYFESRGIRVVGAIFNRLAMDGYYSRDSCEEAVGLYFSKYGEGTHAYGFIPEIPQLIGASPPPVANSGVALAEPTTDPTHSNDWSKDDNDRIQALLLAFTKYCNVAQLLADAREQRLGSTTHIPHSQPLDAFQDVSESLKRKPVLTRDEIESSARKRGAKGG